MPSKPTKVPIYWLKSSWQLPTQSDSDWPWTIQCFSTKSETTEPRPANWPSKLSTQPSLTLTKSMRNTTRMPPLSCNWSETTRPFGLPNKKKQIDLKAWSRFIIYKINTLKYLKLKLYWSAIKRSSRYDSSQKTYQKDDESEAMTNINYQHQDKIKTGLYLVKPILLSRIVFTNNCLSINKVNSISILLRCPC